MLNYSIMFGMTVLGAGCGLMFSRRLAFFGAISALGWAYLVTRLL